MANEKPIRTRRELESHIVAEAWRDPKYKAKLLKNAKSVLEQELKTLDSKVKLPADLKVEVHEESPTQMHLVLPRDPREIAPNVSDENLAALAPQTIAVVVTNVSNVVLITNVMVYPQPVMNVIDGGIEVSTVQNVNLAAVTNVVS